MTDQGFTWMGAQHCRPSGLRIKSAMTARGFFIIWLPAYAGMMLGFDELYYLGVSMSTVTPMSMYLFRSAGLYER